MDAQPKSSAQIINPYNPIRLHGDVLVGAIFKVSGQTIFSDIEDAMRKIDASFPHVVGKLD